MSSTGIFLPIKMIITRIIRTIKKHRIFCWITRKQLTSSPFVELQHRILKLANLVHNKFDQTLPYLDSRKIFLLKYNCLASSIKSVFWSNRLEHTILHGVRATRYQVQIPANTVLKINISASLKRSSDPRSRSLRPPT